MLLWKSIVNCPSGTDAAKVQGGNSSRPVTRSLVLDLIGTADRAFSIDLDSSQNSPLFCDLERNCRAQLAPNPLAKAAPGGRTQGNQQCNF